MKPSFDIALPFLGEALGIAVPGLTSQDTIFTTNPRMQAFLRPHEDLRQVDSPSHQEDVASREGRRPPPMEDPLGPAASLRRAIENAELRAEAQQQQEDLRAGETVPLLTEEERFVSDEYYRQTLVDESLQQHGLSDQRYRQWLTGLILYGLGESDGWLDLLTIPDVLYDWYHVAQEAEMMITNSASYEDWVQ